jgi:hypothetical protein
MIDGDWHTTNTTIITNLDRPTQTWTLSSGVEPSDRKEGGYLDSFTNVTATRFSLESSSYRGNFVFEEIDLSKAYYEP